MPRYQVYDWSHDVSWGIFDDLIEAEAFADELRREDYTCEEISVDEVDENGDPIPDED